MKKNLLVVAVFAAVALSACSSAEDKASSMAESAVEDASSMAESMASDAVESASSMAESMTDGAMESEKASKGDMAENQIKGTISEIKDMQFVIESDKGSFVLSFDKAPEGLADVKDGDMVEVIYTGELSEAEPFTGEVLSVKAAK